MNIKQIQSVTSAALAITSITTGGHAGTPVPPSPITLCTRLMYPNGKPATDAVVRVYLLNDSTHNCTTETFRPHKAGIVSLTFSSAQLKSSNPYLDAESPTGVALWTIANPNSTPVTILRPFTNLRIHVVDSDGKPLPNVRVSPTGFDSPEFYGGWSDNIPCGWTQTTDDHGTATITKLPQGCKLKMGVADNRYLEPNQNIDINLAKSPTTPDAVMTLTKGFTRSGTITCEATHKPTPGIHVTALSLLGDAPCSFAVTDKAGNFRLSRLEKGKYYITTSGRPDWVSQPQMIDVADGTDNAVSNISLIHGGLFTGKITDTRTGRPLANVDVKFMNMDQPDILFGDVFTGPDGAYTLRLTTGRTRLNIQPAFRTDSDYPELHIDVKDGDIKTINFQFKVPTPIYGTVLDPNGKPAPGAIVVVSNDGNRSDTTWTTNHSGRFTLDTYIVEPNAQITAWAGDNGTASPVIYKGGDRITLHLAASQICRVIGTVIDTNGKPIAGATVAINRIEGMMDAPSNEPQTKSDSNGKYTLRLGLGAAPYNISARAPGWTYCESSPFTASQDRLKQIPPIVLKIEDSFAAGTVLDSKGSPVAGATISNSVNPGIYTNTDNTGHFVLPDLPHGQTHINISAGPANSTSDIESGTKNNIIRLAGP